VKIEKEKNGRHHMTRVIFALNITEVTENGRGEIDKR